MEDFLEGFSENITEWQTIREMTELDLDDPPQNVEKVDHRIHRFPRQDFIMYGIMPKMEQRTYIKCRECKLIFSPFDISYHKTCVGTITPSKTHTPERKPKSRGGSGKKNLNNFTLSRVFAKTSSPNRGHNKDRESSSKSHKVIANQGASALKFQEINVIPEVETKGASPGVSSPSCLSNDSLSLDGDSSSPIRPSSSRSSKKSRKIKSTKEFDADIHCGVIDAHKGPCLRSITCSNHRIQLKKLVPGRSKDIHQLIAEKRLAKERDLLNQSLPESDSKLVENVVEHNPVVIDNSIEVLNEVSPSTYVSEIIVDTKHNNVIDCVEEEVEEVKDDMKPTEEFIEALHDTNHIEEFKFTSNSSIHRENCLKSLENYDFTQLAAMSPQKDDNYFTNLENLRFGSDQQQEEIKFLENFDFTHLTPMSPLNKEEYECKSLEGFRLAQIQPMSPLELDESLKEETFVSKSIANVPIDDRPVNFKIPDLDLEVSNVSSHPKPITVPNYGMKKFGGALLFNKPQIQLQRNDILRAVNDSRISFSVFETNLTKKKRNHCNLSINDTDIEYKQMRLDPNLNHFLMQCEIRKPYDEVLLEECLQENFGRNTFTSTIDFE